MNDVWVINPVVADPCLLIKTSIHIPVGDMSRREPGDSLPSPALSSLDQSSSIRFVATGTDEALNAIDIPFRVDTTLQY